MTAPVLDTRTITQYRAPGTKQWYRIRRWALIRAAWLLIKNRCPQTEQGIYCNSEETGCKWHALRRRGYETYGQHVANRLVRMWMRKHGAQ